MTDPIMRRGTTAQLVVRGHLARTSWLYSLAARPRARRLLRVLGLTYVPARDEPVKPGTVYVDIVGDASGFAVPIRSSACPINRSGVRI